MNTISSSVYSALVLPITVTTKKKKRLHTTDLAKLYRLSLCALISPTFVYSHACLCSLSAAARVPADGPRRNAVCRPQGDGSAGARSPHPLVLHLRPVTHPIPSPSGASMTFTSFFQFPQSWLTLPRSCSSISKARTASSSWCQSSGSCLSAYPPMYSKRCRWSRRTH
jgi:hypothetical protein